MNDQRPLFIIARTFGAASLLGITLLLSGASIAAPVKPVPESEKPESARKVFEQSRSRIYQIRTLTVDGGAQNSTGSGFLVEKDGLIATNWHVISDYILDPGRYRLEAIRTDGRKIEVNVVAIDSMNDLALLKADGETGNPFSIHQSLLVKGEKGFSLGNPSGIGFTVVEGIYNGVAEKSLSGVFHFTAAINAGMSGGPALSANGNVFGVNVARMTDGNLISFVVPVEKLTALMAMARTANPTAKSLLEEARQGMIDGQEEIANDVIGSPLKVKEIGIFVVPVESRSASRCGGTSKNEEEEGYAREWVFCVAKKSITAGGAHTVAVMWSEYRVVKNLGLDAYRFAARISDHLTGDKDDGGDRKIVGSYQCRTSFVKLKGGTVRATLCKRPYKQLVGLIDAHLRLATVDSSEAALIGDLHLRGFTESNVKRLARWYLETIEWKR